MPIVYQTTNKVNGNIYVGVHTGARRTYLGSGDNLKRAIDKYGKENFTRETLFEGTSEEVLEKENEIVNAEFIARRDTYNICLGGGMPPVKWGNQHKTGKKESYETRMKKQAAFAKSSTHGNSLRNKTPEFIAKMAKAKKGNDYATFWKHFGTVLKEGPAEDTTNQVKIAKLLRFSTTHTDLEEQDQPLEDYVARMQEKQEKIYYVVAENFNTAKKSPHLEVFRKKGIEVLLLSDRVDDWLMNHLREFDGKQFQDVARGALELAGDSEEEKEAQETLTKQSEALVERVSKVLENRVSEVRATARLTDSAACLVVGDFDMGSQMRRIMEAAGQEMPESKPILEINPAHPLAEMLDQEPDEDRFESLANIIFDQATLVEGGQLDDPADYVSRMNKLLVEMRQV